LSNWVPITAAFADATGKIDEDPQVIRGLRREAIETLARFRPRTLGQASRLAGISPADVTVVAMWVRRRS
jgi:tRNA uridine 5-carboxymethylaminomethyl modification enzyme